MRTLANGKQAMRQNGNAIFLQSLGATPQGDRPFLHRFDFNSKSTDELFRCDTEHYETVVALLDDAGTKILTRRESPTEPPNYFVRSAGQTEARAVTHFDDPTPELRKIAKQLVTYQRPDGVPLSFTLYLPPGYRKGTALPTVVWAYPYEYTDASTAGQISGSTKRFTTVTGSSPLFFALRGYAVLFNAAMPVIGDPAMFNNTYLEQIVMDAKAAIDKAAEMGVTDPARVGVGGHSYGAFMTANLLTHSNLFKAGIAESGAYNRTLTPFGFQTERRTIWEAPDVYLKMSPFLSADKVKSALLLIHGEADDNTGTFPIQSERMYAAVRGNGGVVRLVTLPYEAHGYRGLESIEHVLYEEISWFDKYVKGAGANGTLNATLQ
jgi:dipeptidyl aminopeptidase/acylaminoacyl peptidase